MSISIGEKAQHVLAAARRVDTSGHHCHWPGCNRAVPPAMWGCKPHWFKLPLELRTRIWRAYKPGQEESETPSREYVEVAREAQAWIEAHTAQQETLL